jgi:hypothetical protein
MLDFTKFVVGHIAHKDSKGKETLLLLNFVPDVEDAKFAEDRTSVRIVFAIDYTPDCPLLQCHDSIEECRFGTPPQNRSVQEVTLK